MRLLLHWYQRAPSRGLARAAVAGLCLVVLTLAGCGATTPLTTTNALPSYNNLPKSYTDPTNLPTALLSCTTPAPASASSALHLWAPDRVIVGLASPSTNLGNGLAVGNAIEHMLPPDVVQQGVTEPSVHIWGAGLSAFVFRVSPACLQQAIDSLNYRVLQNNGIAFTIPSGSATMPVEITSASPDWYIGAAGDGIAGSPGGPPLRPGSSMQQPKSPGAGMNATVYVLDSADKLDTTGTNPAIATGITDKPNPTMYTSLCPTTPGTNAPITTSTCFIELTSLSATTTESDWPVVYESTYLREYGQWQDTSIREHGLFVSDLIHHLAPKANIQLLRTLNDQGAGDTVDLMDRLSDVLNAPPPTATTVSVANMSLTTELSPGCLLDIWENWASYVSQAQAGNLACANPVLQVNPEQSYLVLMFAQLDQLIQALHDGGYRLVAAAGTHLENAGDPYAGMPAAFCNVMAVTAVTDASSKAGTSWQFIQSARSSPTTDPFTSSPNASPSLAPWISNFPYLAAQTCLQVPSVNVIIRSLSQGKAGAPPMPTLHPTNPGDAVYAVGSNVCSLYAQDPPNLNYASPPQSGYQYWSGTSFATAIISGNLAANSGSIPGTLDESQPCT